jgi:hypothetical protein
VCISFSLQFYTNLTLFAFSVRSTVGWIPVNIDEIIEDYGEHIYDSSDPTDRISLTRQNLEDLPLQDTDRNPIPIFDKDGYHLQRRLALFKDGSHPYGVLMKSDKLQDLFRPLINTNDDNELPIPGPTTPTPFTFYPQAGLRSVGHIQANGLITHCYPLIAQIDRALRHRDHCQRSVTPFGDSDDSDGLPDNAYEGMTVISGISSQCYNAVVHNTRGRTAQHHDAQVGLVTSALAGAWASPNTAASRTATKILENCTRKLPHDAFADKIKNPAIQRDLRLENVYCINLDALPKRDRNGR